VVRISPAAPVVPPQPLSVGAPVNGSLTSNARITYVLGGDPSRPLILSLNGRIGATLTDGIGQIAGVLSSQLEGGAFYLPASAATYQLELLNDSELPSAPYTLALNPAGDSAPIVTPEVGATDPAIVLPVLPVSGNCVLATLQAGVVNVRRFPDANAEIITTISPTSVYNVVGRNADSSWYEINHGQGTGWVAAFVTRRGGDCSNVPVTFSPPTLTPEATQQIAGDNEVTTSFSYARDINMGFSGALSYPQGNASDTIAYTLVDLPSPMPTGANQPEFRYRISCSAPAIGYVEIRFSNGTYSVCNPDGTNYVTYLTDTTPRSDFFTIGFRNNVADFGAPIYVTWRVSFNWYMP
jgi:hypothetical protein